MIAGDDELGNLGELAEEGAGGFELTLAGALGKVAGDDDEVRSGVGERSKQGFDEGRIFAAKVNVRDVGEGLHGMVSGGGQRTLSDAGRVLYLSGVARRATSPSSETRRER